MHLFLLLLVQFLVAAASESRAHHLLANPPGVWPPYVRGKNAYQWVMTKRALQNGITSLGAHERLRTALHELVQGKPIKLTAVGGSITAGVGTTDAPSWPAYVANYLNDQYGNGSVQLVNAAVSGTGTSYMSLCHNIHIPADSNIIFVEYAVNDPPTSGGAMFNSRVRAHYEQLLRTLLNYPKRPAVFVMHAFPPSRTSTNHPSKPGAYWTNAEMEQQEFASYYHLPAVSVKASCYELMVTNTPGFDLRHERMEDVAKYTDVAWLSEGPTHPSGHTGARVMAELAMYFFDQVINQLLVEPVTEDDYLLTNSTLPRPMLPNNFESKCLRCFVGDDLQHVVTATQGYKWISEGKDAKKPKWGMVAMEPGSFLDLTVDTDTFINASPSAGNQMVSVSLFYLRSYENMGTAKVQCTNSCVCKEITIDGHHAEHTSQPQRSELIVTQARNCTIRVTVQSKTSSTKYKVKITGLVVGGASYAMDVELARAERAISRIAASRHHLIA